MIKPPTNPNTGHRFHRSRCRRRSGSLWIAGLSFLWLIGWGGAVPLFGQSDIPVPQFETGTPDETGDEPASLTTKEGYFQLEWELPGEQSMEETAQFQVEQSRQPDFQETRRRYQGRDTASFISGLGNGNFYYRVRVIHPEDGIQGDWSKPLEVIVDHHSLNQAWTLFGIGAVVFIATVVMILAGNKKVFSSEAETDPKR